MDTKLLLVKSITLLYLESQVTAKGANSAQLVTECLALIKGGGDTSGIVAVDYGKDAISALRDVARWMAQQPMDMTYDKTELMQRLLIATNTDEKLYDALLAGMLPEYGEEKLKERCFSYRRQLRGFLEEAKASDILKKAYLQTHYKNGELHNWRENIKTLRAQLLDYELEDGAERQHHRGLVSEIHFGDILSIEREFGAMKDEISSNGALRFGLQGLNRMLGAARGGRRGELMVVGALQHNYKSGFTLDMFRHAAMYNTPYMFNRERKPLLLRISLENPLRNDVMHLYKSLVEQQTGLPVDLENLDVSEAASYIKGEMERNGYYIAMKHFDPSDFTYHDLFEVIEALEADGYEVHMLNIDYLNLMNKRGCDAGPLGADTRSLFRRVRNFGNCAARKMFTVTPHQLSTDAKIMTRQGVTNFVKEIANKGYYDSCRTLDQECDVELYIHKEIINGESYLTMQRGKHRGIPVITPLKDLYCVYKFADVGNIIDDVLRDDMSRRQVGGGTAREGYEVPWYDAA